MIICGSITRLIISPLFLSLSQECGQTSGTVRPSLAACCLFFLSTLSWVSMLATNSSISVMSPCLFCPLLRSLTLSAHFFSLSSLLLSPPLPPLCCLRPSRTHSTRPHRGTKRRWRSSDDEEAEEEEAEEEAEQEHKR